MDSDRFSLGIRDCVFLLFHLQGTRDVFACRSVPSVWMKACDFNEEGMWGKYVCECRVFSWFLSVRYLSNCLILVIAMVGFYNPCSKGAYPVIKPVSPFPLLSELPQWHGVLELSETHGNLLLKELLKAERNILYLYFINRAVSVQLT